MQTGAANSRPFLNLPSSVNEQVHYHLAHFDMYTKRLRATSQVKSIALSRLTKSLNQLCRDPHLWHPSLSTSAIPHQVLDAVSVHTQSTALDCCDTGDAVTVG